LLEARLAPAVLNVISTADNTNPVITAGHAGTAADPFQAPSLRSAISFANATPGNNTINLAMPGTYKITLPGAGDDTNATGDFDIIPNPASPAGSSLTIANTSGGAVTVDGNHLDRVFDINPTPLFTATLNGAQQVPPTNSVATGTGTIQLTADETAINFTGTFTGLSGPPTAAHLHNAPAGANGPIAQDANGNNIEFAGVPAATVGTIPLQTFAVNADFVAQLQAGNIYENIHTAAFPNGEIRGQFAPAPKFSVIMQGFTITGGVAQPGDTLAGSGGGIRDLANASLTLTNMVVTGNTATADGGGVVMGNLANTPWTLTLNNTTISNNHAGDAGGGIDTDGSGKVFVNPGSVITGNTSVAQGAGIWLDTIPVGNTMPSASLTVNGTVISNNRALTAAGVGGGIGNAGNGAVTIVNSSVTGNFAGAFGGGFGDENNQGSLTVAGSTFLNNTTPGNGGGIAEGGPATSISGSEIDGNAAGGSGGGVFVAGMTLTIQASTIANNTSAGNGGGVELDTAGAGLFQGSTITNTTITGNSAVNNAGANGGGIDAGANFTGDLKLQSDTVNGNFASMGGGVFWAGGGNIGVQNTILAGNAAVAGPDTASTLTFTATLNGAQQVPPVPTPGTGTGTFTLSPDQTTLTVNSNFVNLLGAALFAHLHNAPAGVSNPAVAQDANGNPIEFAGVPNATAGVIPQQNFTVNNAFVNQLVLGNIYENIHTTFAPVTGEIRGQLTPAGGQFIDLGGNLIGVAGTGSGFTAATTQTGTSANPLNPLLGPLQDNGAAAPAGAPGSTMNVQTEAPLAFSPAIGHGILSGAPATDERGFPSVVNGAVNVGAASQFSAPTHAPTPSAPSGSPSAPIGTVFNVNTTVDILNPPAGVVTLRSAIQAANATPGDVTINLTVAGTYRITIPGAGEDHNATGDFDILGKPGGGNLLIQNTSGGAVTVDGNHLDRVFDINPNGGPAAFTVTMQGFTITGGVAADAANPDGLAASGGGIRDQGTASLTLTNMVVTGNNATADGAGVVMGNTANSTWTLTVNNSVISNNHTGDAGGGIDTDGTGTVVINPGTVVTGNTDLNQGAGIYIDALPDQNGNLLSANMTMTGTVVSNNVALVAGVTGSGGGISNAGNGAMTIASSTVSGNVSGGNGGGFSDENNVGTLAVSNSLFLNNTALGDGAGIQEGGPSTTITSTEIDGNASGGNGAGLFANGTTVTIQASTLANNTSAGNGGGIELDTTGIKANQTASTITNTTITGNSALNNAGANGGGIDAGSGFTGDLTLLNDTINGNFASVGGGVSWAGTQGSTFSVQNTIIAGNTALIGPDAASNLLFTALLSGANEVAPGDVPVNTGSPGTGTASILLSPDQTTATINVSWSGLLGNALKVHIHNAPAGHNGPVIFDLTGVLAATTGAVPQQTFPITAAQVAQLLAGNFYSNIHTTAFPMVPGEVRGQFAVAAGAFNDLGGNLIGTSGIGSGNITFTSATTQTGTLASSLNPLLGPLQNNGGPTIGAPGTTITLQTEAPLTGSPAIDAGVIAGAPNTDERGFVRLLVPADPPDVGAVETGPMLTATATPVLTAAEGQVFTGEVATFTDRNPNATVADFPLSAITINWGDGSTSNATQVTEDANKVFHVFGSHTYAEDGPTAQPLTVTINGPLGATATTSFTPVVAEADLTVHALAISITEGKSFSGPVATFNDPTATASDAFSALINWGDGSSGAGTVTGPGGNYTVSGSHSYAEDGHFAVGVTVTENGSSQLFTAALNAAQQVPPTNSPATGTASLFLNAAQNSITVFVSSSGLLPPGVITAQHLHVAPAGANGPVAQDASGANIELGTANPATGTFTVNNAEPQLFVTQLQAGNVYTNIHTLAFPGGEIRGQFTSTNFSSGTATVGEDGATITGTTILVAEGQALSGVVAVLSDPGSPDPGSAYTASIDWGDGSSGTGTVTGSGGTYSISGTHTYTEGGQYTITVTATETGVNPSPIATGTSTASVAEADLVVHALPITAAEGKSFSGPVATFSDPTAPNNDAFSALINWGDGSSGAGTVTGSGGNYTVSGSHSYAEDGHFAVGVTVTENGSSQLFTATLNAAQQVPPTNSPATGAASLFLNAAQNSITVFVSSSGLVPPGVILAQHLHVAPAGANGPVAQDASGANIELGTANPATGTFAIDNNPSRNGGGLLSQLLRGNVYVNIHTLAFPGGEIRGQFTSTNFSSGTATVGESDLTVHATALSATEGQSFSGSVATFSDGTATANDTFTALINWGDGASGPGTVTGSGGNYTVSGSHTYAEDGQYTVTVTVTETGASPGASGTATASVAENDLTVHTTPLTTPEGQSLSGPVGTFSDPGAPGSDVYSAAINWGDGTSSAGTVTGSAGNYTASGSHTYADEGNYTVTLTVSETGAANGSASATFTATATEQDALSASSTSPTSFPATAGVSASGTVAVFQDAGYPGNVASDFTATIDWGDGTPTDTGSVSGGGGAPLTVTGSHTYAHQGSYPIKTTLSDDAPGTASASATSTASVAPSPPSVLDFTGGFAGSASRLTYNGSALINGTRAELTDGGNYEAGSVFSSTPLSIANFSTYFTFQTTAGSPTAGGFTFAVQGVGPTALGPNRGGLGYGAQFAGQGGGIPKSVAVKFDLFDTEGEGPNSTGLYVNGAAPTVAGSIDLTPAGIDLHSGHVFKANLDYDGTTLTVTIKDTQTGASATQHYAVNIPALVGGSTAYVGFTGSTGGVTATQDILTWYYDPPANGTPPSSAITATGQNLVVQASHTVQGAIATFRDADLVGAPGNYAVQVTWGDGQTSAGQVVQNGDGSFIVLGTHTYARLGAYAIALQISDSDGDSTSAAANAYLVPGQLLAVANGLTHSYEYYSNFVTGAYQRYLGRTPNLTEINGWVGVLQSGLSDERLEAGFIGSPEYINDHGGQGAGWVTGMYQDLLGRTPAPSEVAGWVNALNNGMAPTAVAYGFAASFERESQRVAADYRTYLGREAAWSEILGWVEYFENGGSNENVIAGFVGSFESYYNHGSDAAQWLDAAYRSILNRPADVTADAVWLPVLDYTAPSSRGN
jgi:hypothetical protein